VLERIATALDRLALEAIHACDDRDRARHAQAPLADIVDLAAHRPAGPDTNPF
jgi:hypothetical protein